MVDIYDNLENYEEILGYDRLKAENKELKQKIGEHESALAKLQKEILQDFDDLTTEHQRLLANYSSLLKTARAEIERKTQVITNINNEKDQLFLKFLSDSTNKNPAQGKRGGKRKAKTKEGIPPPCKPPAEESLLNKEALIQNKSKDDHSKEQTTPTQDRAQKQQVALRTLIKDKNKENKSSGVVPCSIASRRKSAPISRLDHPVFSSDEEDETKSPAIPPRDEPDVVSERFIENRLKQIASEVCVLDNRDHHQRESQRESLIDRPTRYSREQETRDWYRDRDRYDDKSRDRDRRRSSNERPLRGRPTYRETNERYRNDNSRHRASPPRGNYQRNKSRDRRREFFERERQEPEFDRYRKPFHHEQPVKHKYHDEYEGSGTKHKHYDDYEEPVLKRRRTDSRNADEYSKDSAQPHDKMYHQWRHTSCQSPDEVFVDTVLPSHPIREIMGTSEIPQPDPRFLSSKYVDVNDGNKKMRLSASAAQVKLSKVGPWTNSTKDQRAPDIREAIPHKEYSRVDHNLANDSMESGEINDIDIYSDIFTDRDHIPSKLAEDANNCDSGDTKRDIPAKKAAIEIHTKNESGQNINSCLEPHMKVNTTEKPIESEKKRIINIRNYKIRKISKPESTLNTISEEKHSNINAVPKPLEVLYNELSESELARKKDISDDVKRVSSLNCGNENKTDHNDSKSKQLKPYIHKNKTSAANIKLRPETKEHLSEHKKDHKTEKEKYRETQNTNSKIRPRSIANRRKSMPAFKHELPRLDINDEVNTVTRKNDCLFTLNTPAKKNMVAGDLELSDESSDSSDLNIKMTQPNIDNKIELEASKQDTKSKGKEKEPIINLKETKTKDIQAKLCDLFGDSSLITPEDLELQQPLPRADSARDPTPLTSAATSSLSFSILKDNDKLSNVSHTQIDNETNKIRTRSSGKNKTHVDDKNTKSSAPIAEEKVKCNDVHTSEDKSKNAKHKEKSDDARCVKTKTNDAAVADSTVAVELPLEVTIPDIPISVEPTNNLIRVLPSVDEKEPDVIKTVIISSGLQPQCLPTTKEIAVNNDKSEDSHFKVFPGLATSTPQRESVKVAPKDPVRAPSVMSDTSDSNCTDKMVESLAPEKSLADTPGKPENAPDMRIFLKRKKKRTRKSNLSQ
ncbi:uncharacterized protein DDB_G0283697 isoform X1 [Plutella xylostella]|uniref:uncharacterized protein DDB_G0283697 isoform X1 n=1 Tax=Plutella xylostella TaxID=51655 RepID=UPI002032756C|nr:uncharacterized protein DDB_G0283697 isoform X1 [Plutella xylostella]